METAVFALICPPSPLPTLPLSLSRHHHHCHHRTPSRCVALLSLHRPITALPACCLIAPAGCCVTSCCTPLLSSSHRAALSFSCSAWLLRSLPSHCPLVLSLCLPLVYSSSLSCPPTAPCQCKLKYLFFLFFSEKKENWSTPNYIGILPISQKFLWVIRKSR
jgi:hypothetical protein